MATPIECLQNLHQLHEDYLQALDGGGRCSRAAPGQG